MGKEAPGNTIFKFALFRLIFTLWNFLIAPLVYKLKYTNNEKRYYCGKGLFNLTYRYPDKSTRDFLITLRIYKRIFASIFRRKKQYQDYTNNSGHGIFDIALSGANLRYDYVRNFSGVKNDVFISKADLLSYSGIFPALAALLVLVTSILPVLLLSVISRNKLNYPMIVEECIECFYLSDILYRKKIRHLNYFCIYERDANLCAYILMSYGIYVNKIPSEVPLYFNNRIVVSDELSLCFAYQEEEVGFFEKTMFINKTSLWGPERVLNAPERFFTKCKATMPKYDIGFFSSANWLREKIGNIDLGDDAKKNEESVLNELVKYTRQNNLSLHIYLHPLEKREEHCSLSEGYYSGILKEHAHVTLSEKNMPSIEGFDEIKTGVALYSTLMFERIYFGFKTIIAPLGYKDFPIQSSSLMNICAKTNLELIEKIEMNTGLSNQDFFEKNDLVRYSDYVI